MEVNDPQENYKTGFIALYRSIRNHWIFKNEKHLKWWLIVLMEANHKPNKINLGYSLYDIKKGQSANSLRTWANLFETGTKQTVNFFKLLQKDGMITRKTLGKGKQSTTLINIENYGSYQYGGETQETTQGTTQGKRKGHTNNNVNNDNKIISKREKNPPPKISKPKETDKELKDKFIAWFNIRRSKHLKKESNIKSLSTTDLTNLKKLKKDYGAEDFNIAFNALQRNKWANDNNMIIPKHFLVNDNFNKYYAEGQTIDDKPLEELTVLERLKRIHK